MDNMNPMQGEPSAKPTTMQECVAKMEQAMSMMQDAMEGLKGDMATEGAEPGESRMSVEQAFGRGFQGDSVDKPY